MADSASISALTSADVLSSSKESYQQIVLKHPDLLAVMPATSSDDWYKTHATAIGELLPVTVLLTPTQMSEFIARVRKLSVSPRTYSPEEILGLVDRLIMNEKFSFSEGEIAPRVYDFLKRGLSWSYYQKSINRFLALRAYLRAREYDVLTAKVKIEEKLALNNQTGVEGQVLGTLTAEQVEFFTAMNEIGQAVIDQIRLAISALNSWVIGTRNYPLGVFKMYGHFISQKILNPNSALRPIVAPPVSSSSGSSNTTPPLEGFDQPDLIVQVMNAWMYPGSSTSSAVPLSPLSPTSLTDELGIDSALDWMLKDYAINYNLAFQGIVDRYKNYAKMDSLSSDEQSRISYLDFISGPDYGRPYWKEMDLDFSLAWDNATLWSVSSYAIPMSTRQNMVYAGLPLKTRLGVAIVGMGMESPYNVIIAPDKNNFSASAEKFFAQKRAEDEALLASPQGKIVYTFLIDVIREMLAQEPETVIELLQSGMSGISQEADVLTSEIVQERAQITKARQEAFQTFMNTKVEAEMSYYQNHLKQAQDDYNAVATDLKEYVDRMNQLQGLISQKIKTLGPVIGYYAYKNQITPEQMNEPAMIKQVLTGLQHSNGEYAQGTKEEAYTVFWPATSGPPDYTPAIPYGVLCSEALSFMQELEEKSQNFELVKTEHQNKMKEIYAGMLTLKEAWKKTEAKINAPEYTQEAIGEFNAIPEARLLQDDLKAMNGPLNEVSLAVKSKQEALGKILDDIEIQALLNAGLVWRDPSGLSFPEKKNVWFGVIGYLEKNQPRFPELQDASSHLAEKFRNGTQDETDTDLLALTKQAILNIMAAQLVYRILERDQAFQLWLKMLHEDKAKANIDYAMQMAPHMIGRKKKDVPETNPALLTPTSPPSTEKKSHALLYAGAGIALLALLKHEKRK